MEGIVDTVLRLSNRQGGTRTFIPSSVDVLGVLSDLIPQLESHYNRKIEIEKSDSVPTIFADKELLVLLISNLIRNIFRHTSREARAWITFAQPTKDFFTIKISDNGPGLSEERLAAANEDKAESDSLGIGLNLCKQIARVSRMGLYFENLSEGGLCVHITCPLNSSN